MAGCCCCNANAFVQRTVPGLHKEILHEHNVNVTYYKYLRERPKSAQHMYKKIANFFCTKLFTLVYIWHLAQQKKFKLSILNSMNTVKELKW